MLCCELIFELIYNLDRQLTERLIQDTVLHDKLLAFDNICFMEHFPVTAAKIGDAVRPILIFMSCIALWSVTFAMCPICHGCTLMAGLEFLLPHRFIINSSPCLTNKH